MALSLSPFPLSFLSPPFPSFRKTHFTVSFSLQIDPAKKRKPKPSFSDQIRDKWSIRNPNLSKPLPWERKNQIQIEESEDEEETGTEGNNSSGSGVTQSIECNSVSFVTPNRVNLPPWVHGDMPKEIHLKNPSEINVQKKANIVEEFEGFRVTESIGSDSVSFVTPRQGNLPPWVHGDMPKETQLENWGDRNMEKEDNFVGELKGLVKSDKNPTGFDKSPVKSEIKVEREASIAGEFDGFVKIDENPIGFVKSPVKSEINLENEANFVGEFEGFFKIDETSDGFVKSPVESEKVRMPWERERNSRNVGGRKDGNAVFAERLIPETELKRLRNVAKRMVERIKVGSAGVNQELVDSIREKWREDEVIKLKFEGAPTLNMKRTHEALETRTGGLVIWRSGTTIALYRGMTYNLPCVQSYTKDRHTSNSPSSRTIEGYVKQQYDLEDTIRTRESSFSRSERYTKDLSKKEIKDLNALDCLLEDLGPRFRDWSGPKPLPVDADLLPSVVPGFRRPFRLLPNGVRQGLSDKETTFYRQSARIMPPHFALGRSRELQGLAMAMVKLWEKSAIAKIAIKRGVHNTNNERMAEELKKLTGGTLLSRNKDYIVFYRGNDFLPPAVAQTLDEAQKLAMLKQDEEEEARQQASIPTFSTKRSAKIPKVAGTLAETIAATSRWENHLSPEDREKMRRDSALARHASMVKYLENKLGIAKGKMKKAEKALTKLQESLSPAQLPTDLETITDEERFLFRKIGLSMKPYLPIGRREMFDGTIVNIHLHWKYREVVKLIVERKSFAHVKQIATGLEAESGGVLVSIDKTMKGHVIILYRGKNYQRPNSMKPKSLLTKRQAWARSIELQRREALKHHMSDLNERIEQLKTELEKMMSDDEIDEETFYSRMDDASSDEETEEEGDEDAYFDDSGKEEEDMY